MLYMPTVISFKQLIDVALETGVLPSIYREKASSHLLKEIYKLQFQDYGHTINR